MGHVVMNKQYYLPNIIIEKVYTDTKGLEYLEGIYRKYIYNLSNLRRIYFHCYIYKACLGVSFLLFFGYFFWHSFDKKE